MAMFFAYPFGVDGTLTAIPNPTQGSGSVSYQEGWGPDYALDLSGGPPALPIPRDQMNQLFYDITNAIQQYQTHAVPDFILASETTNGLPYPYDLYAQVRYDPGTGVQIWENQVSGNTTTPPDPSWLVISGSPIPSGFILDFGGTSAPSGYLLCDGSAYSRTTYAALFSAIGTIWGVGDGSTTFNVPNLARSVRMGVGGTPSSTIGNTVGSIGGTETVSLTSNQNGDHIHFTVPGYTLAGVQGNTAAGARGFQSGGGGTQTSSIVGGAGQPHNNLPPSVVVYPCIKI